MCLLHGITSKILCCMQRARIAGIGCHVARLSKQLGPACWLHTLSSRSAFADVLTSTTRAAEDSAATTHNTSFALPSVHAQMKMQTIQSSFQHNSAVRLSAHSKRILSTLRLQMMAHVISYTLPAVCCCRGHPTSTSTSSSWNDTICPWYLSKSSAELCDAARGRFSTWMQAADGHLKPIPPEDDFATPRRGGTGGRTSPNDPDLALAIRLQQEEMTRMRGPPQGAPQGPLPPFTRNPVGPTPPASLPQRARSALLLWRVCHS